MGYAWVTADFFKRIMNSEWVLPGLQTMFKGITKSTWVMPGLQIMFKGITKNNGMDYAWVTEDF